MTRLFFSDWRFLLGLFDNYYLALRLSLQDALFLPTFLLTLPFNLHDFPCNNE
jgi:hypothetical protein